ncbi:hypothetical protein C8Q75DRAFT_334673 [Abortiporus biennis]|nr:hypothetical protein C8Q75DRAFT_334673 [Abortiporus biennis]
MCSLFLFSLIVFSFVLVLLCFRFRFLHPCPLELLPSTFNVQLQAVSVPFFMRLFSYSPPPPSTFPLARTIPPFYSSRHSGRLSLAIAFFFG